jgi:hypothetical protein
MTREAAGKIWPFAAGFALVGGSMVAGLVSVLLRDAPALPWSHAAEAAPVPEEPPRGPRVYVPLTDVLTISLRKGGPRMEAGLAFAVRGSTEELLGLTTRVQAQIGPIEAAVVQAAQDVVAEGAESLRVHAELPGRIRAAVNDLIGSEDWPEPVDEVLITSLVMR